MGWSNDYYVHKGNAIWMPWTRKSPLCSSTTLPWRTSTSSSLRLTRFRCNTSCKTRPTSTRHVLINGVTGTGKSVAVANFLSNFLKTEDVNSAYVAFSVTFSAQTTSRNFQETMEAKLVRRRGDKELGPPVGKKMIVTVDDCNMPQLEQYGASPPIELLRQIITQNGCYDRKKLNFKDYVDMSFIASCGEPGGGKNELTQRLTSQFYCICIPSLSGASMKTIFSGILNGYLSTFPPSVSTLASRTVDATIEIYQRIAREMLPTPEKTHYTFNLRDVSNVIQGPSARKSHASGVSRGLLALVGPRKFARLPRPPHQ